MRPDRATPPRTDWGRTGPRTYPLRMPTDPAAATTRARRLVLALVAVALLFGGLTMWLQHGPHAGDPRATPTERATAERDPLRELPGVQEVQDLGPDATPHEWADHRLWTLTPSAVDHADQLATRLEYTPEDPTEDAPGSTRSRPTATAGVVYDMPAADARLVAHQPALDSETVDWWLDLVGRARDVDPAAEVSCQVEGDATCAVRTADPDGVRGALATGFPDFERYLAGITDEPSHTALVTVNGDAVWQRSSPPSVPR